jgi:hypothetical protein
MFGLNRLALVKKAFGNRSAKGAKQSRRRVGLRVEALERRELLSAGEPIAWTGWNDLGQQLQAMSPVYDAQHNLHLFGIGTNNTVYQDVAYSDLGGLFAGWKSVGGVAAQSISAILDSHGSLNVFVIGTNHDLYWTSQPTYDGASGSWTCMGGWFGSFTTVLDPHGNLDVFAVGGDNLLYAAAQSATSGAWGSWYRLGGAVQSSSSLNPNGNLSASLDSQGNLHVFYIGTDNAVYCYMQPNTNGLWTWSYSRLGGWVWTISSSLDALGNLDVFGIGADNAVWYTSQPRNSGSFSSWTSLGLGPNQETWQSVHAGLDGHGNLDVFAIGTDGVVRYVVAPPNPTPGPWMKKLGDSIKSISLVPDNVTGNMDLFAIGSSNNEAYVMESATYRYVSGGALFGPNGPSYLDVQQGGMGDCWLLASLAEVAARAPVIITSMFTYVNVIQPNGIEVGKYQVRFYDQNNQPYYVLVDPELPDGGLMYDHPVNGVLWVALAEKAYAVATGYNDYYVLNGGDAATALQAITGRHANDSNINPNAIATAWIQGQFIVLCTPGKPASSYIEGGHCYALVGYNPSSANAYEIFNPWGTAANGWNGGTVGGKYGLWWVSASFLSQNFGGQSLTSAAPGMVLGLQKTELPVTLGAGRQADPSEVLFATLGGSSNPSRPPDDGSADMLARSRADSAASLSPADVASLLVRHKRASAADALFADANSFERR